MGKSYRNNERFLNVTKSTWCWSPNRTFSHSLEFFCSFGFLRSRRLWNRGWVCLHSLSYKERSLWPVSWQLAGPSISKPAPFAKHYRVMSSLALYSDWKLWKKWDKLISDTWPCHICLKSTVLNSGSGPNGRRSFLLNSRMQMTLFENNCTLAALRLL